MNSINMAISKLDREAIEYMQSNKGLGPGYTDKFYEEFKKLDTLLKYSVINALLTIGEKESDQVSMVISALYCLKNTEEDKQKEINKLKSILDYGFDFLYSFSNKAASN